MFGLFKKDKPKEDGDYITTDANALIESKANDIKMIDMNRKKKIDRIPASIYNLLDNRGRFMCKYILKYPFICNLNEMIKGKITVFNRNEIASLWDYDVLLKPENEAYIQYSTTDPLTMTKNSYEIFISNESFRDTLVDAYIEASNRLPIDLYWLETPLELFFGRLWILKEDKNFIRSNPKANDINISNYIKRHRATVWGNIEFMERENPIITAYDEYQNIEA